jgi:hypothetical protein
MTITPEAKIQQEAFNWFNNNYCLKHKQPSLVIHSVPNEIPVSLPPKERARAIDLLTKTGMVKGASDLMIHGINGRCVHAECKTETGSQSPAQLKFEQKIKDLNGIYFVFRSLQEFKENISKHIKYLTDENSGRN